MNVIIISEQAHKRTCVFFFACRKYFLMPDIDNTHTSWTHTAAAIFQSELLIYQQQTSYEFQDDCVVGRNDL